MTRLLALLSVMVCLALATQPALAGGVVTLHAPTAAPTAMLQAVANDAHPALQACRKGGAKAAVPCTPDRILPSAEPQIRVWPRAIPALPADEMLRSAALQQSVFRPPRA